MNAISRQPAIHHESIPDAHSDAQTELARHLVDLRVHAVVMLASAGLALFSGIRLCDAVDMSVPVNMASWAMPCNVLSICALSVFVGIAALCLFEAHRCWRKAAITGAHAHPTTRAPRSIILDEFVPASRRHAGAGLFSRIRRLEPL